MRLVQGLTSALSSGILIYASCLELVAGDFTIHQQLKIGPTRAQVIALVSLVVGVIRMAGIGLRVFLGMNLNSLGTYGLLVDLALNELRRTGCYSPSKSTHSVGTRRGNER